MKAISRSPTLILLIALLIISVVGGYSQSNNFGLVINGGFETGDFTGWSLSSDVCNTYVDDGSTSGIIPYSGKYEAVLGGCGSTGYLSQSLLTSPGAHYLLSFWVNNPFQDPVQFLASWNNTTLFDTTNLMADDWTNMQFLVSATNTSTLLQFGFEDDFDNFALDSVDVESNFVQFIAAPLNGEAPLTVNFNSPSIDNQGNAITNWLWSFGDQSVSTNQNVIHVYDYGGTFAVGLDVINSKGVSVKAFGPASVVVNITNAPTLPLTLNINGMGFADYFGLGGEELLTVGYFYTLTANPQPGWQFVDWTGGTNLPLNILTTNTTIAFVMQSNLILQANFDQLPVQPSITSIQLAGSNIMLTATNGRTWEVMTLLTTTNLALPLSQWLPLETNSPGVNETFAVTVTNALKIGLKQGFYTLQANSVLGINFFYTNYNGLFFPANGATEESAGFLNLTVSFDYGVNIYSGIMFLNGAALRISGAFNAQGDAINHLNIPGAEPVVISMALNTIKATVTGSISSTGWTSALYATGTTPAGMNMSGAYTIDLAPTGISSGVVPPGNGNALITNDAGNLSINGTLSDGTVFNQVVPLASDGYIPLYASLYNNTGLLIGWLNVSDNVISGDLTWIKSNPDGFTNIISADGETYSVATNVPAIRIMSDQ